MSRQKKRIKNSIKATIVLALLLGAYCPFIENVSAASPTVTTNDATGMTRTNATLQGTLTDDGDEFCSVGFEYGLTALYGTDVDVLSAYIYVAGVTTNKVFQYWQSNMTKKAETADYGGQIFTVVEDSTYVYAGGETTNKVFQYWQSNMTKKAETASYGLIIRSLIQDSTYIYVGGEPDDFNNPHLCQYWKSNMTKKAETEEYTLYLALAQDDTYVYASGSADNAVIQYWKSNMTTKKTSFPYGSGTSVHALAQDDTYVYAGGESPYTIYKYWKSNLTKKAESASYGGIIYALADDSIYVYVAGATTNRASQYWKSNMTYKAQTTSYGGIIYALVDDSTYVYAGGATTKKVYQYWKSNMTKRAESTDYGGTISTLSLRDIYTTGNTFSYNITGLTPGATYHFRAVATNSIGTANGSDMAFVTLPNTLPAHSSSNPANGSVNQSLSLTWSIYISDADGDAFTWHIECSNEQTATASGTSNGTKQISLVGLDYSTTYYVWVNATDGYGWTRAIYHFTVKANNASVLSNPIPANGSTTVSVSLRQWMITIQDQENDTFNWTIETRPDVGNSSGFNERNGTKTVNLSGLRGGVTYTVYVNTTGNLSGSWMNGTYFFKVVFEKITSETPYVPPSENAETEPGGLIASPVAIAVAAIITTLSISGVGALVFFKKGKRWIWRK